MKTNVLALLLLGQLSATALADGLPFDPETQIVHTDTLRFRLSKAQIDELSSTGKVTLAPSQLEVLHRLYPKALAVQHVDAATFNDNVEYEEEGPPDALVLWVKADEIAITIRLEVFADEARREKVLAEQDPSTMAYFRISPNGQIYREGKAMTLEQAVEEIVRIGKMPPEKQPLEGVRVVVAPPWHGHGERFDSQGREFPTAQEIFAKLEATGEANHCPVFKCW